MAAKPKPKPTTASKGPMTKTVIKKVSPNVKVIVPGSKPRTQSATEKAAIMEKAKTKTPAKRAQAAISKKVNIQYNKREEARMRQYISNQAYREALKDAGYKSPPPGSGFGPGPTAAQTKAANKAVSEAERAFKAARAKAKAAKTALRRGGRGGGGGGGLNINDIR
jgi:hypothetical protein